MSQHGPLPAPPTPIHPLPPGHVAATAAAPERSRGPSLAALVAASLAVMLVVLLLVWLLLRDESQALQDELGLARQDATEQLGTLEDDLDSLDSRLDELPPPGGSSTPAPPVAQPVPAPVPVPVPAPQPAPEPAPRAEDEVLAGP